METLLGFIGRFAIESHCALLLSSKGFYLKKKARKDTRKI